MCNERVLCTAFMACFYPSLLFLSLLVALQGVVVSRASEKITLIYAVQILFLGNWMAVERNLALFVRGITFWERFEGGDH